MGSSTPTPSPLRDADDVASLTDEEVAEEVLSVIYGARAGGGPRPANATGTTQVFFDHHGIEQILERVTLYDFSRDGSLRVAVFDVSDLPYLNALRDLADRAPDGKYIFAALVEMDADIVLLDGLLP